MGKTDSSLKKKKKKKKWHLKPDHANDFAYGYFFFQVNEVHTDSKGLNKNPHNCVCLSRLQMYNLAKPWMLQQRFWSPFTGQGQGHLKKIELLVSTDDLDHHPNQLYNFITTPETKDAGHSLGDQVLKMQIHVQKEAACLIFICR